MKPKTPHKHAYFLKALAAGWKCEGKNYTEDAWAPTICPILWEECRVVPDEDGWLPWFGDGECPVDGETLVDFTSLVPDGGLSWTSKANNYPWVDTFAYRIHKEEKKEEPIDPYAELKAANKDPTKQIRIKLYDGKYSIWHDSDCFWNFDAPVDDYEIRDKPKEDEYEYLWIIEVDRNRMLSSTFHKTKEDAIAKYGDLIKALERCEWSKRKI